MATRARRLAAQLTPSSPTRAARDRAEALILEAFAAVEAEAVAKERARLAALL